MQRLSPTLIRPLMAVGLIGAAALALSLVLLALTSWRALVLVDPVRNHLHHLNELHEASRQTQNLLVRHIANQPPPTEAEVGAIRARLSQLVARDGNLDARTPELLRQARAALEPRAVTS